MRQPNKYNTHFTQRTSYLDPHNPKRRLPVVAKHRHWGAYPGGPWPIDIDWRKYLKASLYNGGISGQLID